MVYYRFFKKSVEKLKHTNNDALPKWLFYKIPFTILHISSILINYQGNSEQTCLHESTTTPRGNEDRSCHSTHVIKIY